ncbi:MAG: hypothetical protein IT348_05885 [Candidatus Eisenbacteria bacterium]|nr:hypothetical protein [Candidatus Eisenbacteria bacterium]
MSARILDHPTKREHESDLDGLAFHLADLAGDDWRTLTADRRAQLRVIAQFATAAAVETRRAS